jgi:hypothetical protein
VIAPASKNEFAINSTPSTNLNVNPKVKNNTGNVPVIPSNGNIEKPSFVSFASYSSTSLPRTSIDPQVDFSDTYYSTVDYGVNSPNVQPSSISMRQAAMRWMKKKLDHNPNAENENLVNTSMALNGNSSQDVTGFDLTSSAVNRLGQATGSNLKLGKESDGTSLTVGKYKVWLNHKR